MTLQVQLPSPDTVHTGLGKLRRAVEKAQADGERHVKEALDQRRYGDIPAIDVRSVREDEQATKNLLAEYMAESREAAMEAGLALRGLAAYRAAEKAAALSWATQIEPQVFLFVYQAQALAAGLSLPQNQQIRLALDTKMGEFRDFKRFILSLDDGVLDLKDLPPACRELLEVPL